MAHAVSSRNEQDQVVAVRRRWWSGWPRWAPYAAAAWSLVYGLAGLYWALGGAGYPFGSVPEDRSTGSVLEPSPAAVLSPVIAALGFAGTVCGVLMARRRPVGGSVTRRFLLGFGWAQALALTVVLQDYTLIAVVAFAPLLVVFAFTGVPGPQGDVGEILYWHRDNLLILFVGGVLWTLAVLAYQRRTRGLCAHCGRGGRAAAWTAPESAARWGRRAVLIAVLSSIPYDVTRVAWFFGYPMGITDAFLEDMQSTPGMLGIGLGLAIASTVGGVLTHGLIARWGEVWPRWVPFKAGRPVALATAIVPALLVAVVLIPGGLQMIRGGDQPFGWGTNYPAMLWVPWGVALGIATLGYYLRRRGTCGHCARG
ncbi:NYN domain-containing protein [Streptomyces virginiae]|uniref:NYN domain-containing protein n=1 Tax=Streptomyces virginiae TaxID=1961 RepID=UPI0036C85BD3